MQTDGHVALRARQLLSVAELAAASRLTPQTLHRLLGASGVRLVRLPRQFLIPVQQLELRLPLFWTSVLVLQQLLHPS